MRTYQDENEIQLKEVVCNRCGKKLKIENGMIKEGCFSADTVFGYFSEKDGIHHRFDLCEVCYDNILADFSIPVTETEEKELC